MILKLNFDFKTDLPYREKVGSLLFAARTCRPDIGYAVNYASQFLNSFGQEHWKFVKRILKYLKGTKNFGIVYGSSGSALQLGGFTDADWANCLKTRKSRSSYIFIFNGGPVSWSSQRQSIVTASTTGSEYIALSEGVKEALWLKRFLKELKINDQPVNIRVDNQSAIKIAENSEYHKRTKYIDWRFHFVRDFVEKNVIRVEYVNFKNQLADILTKPLPYTQFSFLRE